MSAASELQALLRFLSQDAKLPLATAMSKVRELQKINLKTPSDIAKSDTQTLQTIFSDEKTSKQVLTAAKRIAKKRTASEANPNAPTIHMNKKKQRSWEDPPLTDAELEEELALPWTDFNEDLLSQLVLWTNRAPVVLAFAVVLLKYTMPEQPLSSRLSLAQAVVSANSRTKAVSIGLESGKSADEEGWGEGQPTVKVMGREIRVMKRWGYQWKEEDRVKTEEEADASTQSTLQSDKTFTHEDMPPLWGIDLEALKKANEKIPAVPHAPGQGNLPIYTAQSARSYLLRAFESQSSQEESQKKPKKKSAAEKSAEKERNLALLLSAIDSVFQSWTGTVDAPELDKKAWSWYVKVRPEVASGQAGWGGKNDLKLSDILTLRRT